jgi:gliding motility-associated lipoprotein GldH
MKIGLFFSAISLILLLTSCQGDTPFFEENKSIPEQSWDKNNVLSFTFDIKDTLAFYDFYFNLRTTTSYEWANLYAFVDMESPNDMVYRDTVELPLADDMGKWYGKNSGSLVENSVLFFKNVNFDKSGTYRVFITQAMRNDELDQIVDVGLKIVEVEGKRKGN